MSLANPSQSTSALPFIAAGAILIGLGAAACLAGPTPAWWQVAILGINAGLGAWLLIIPFVRAEKQRAAREARIIALAESTEVATNRLKEATASLQLLSEQNQRRQALAENAADEAVKKINAAADAARASLDQSLATALSAVTASLAEAKAVIAADVRSAREILAAEQAALIDGLTVRSHQIMDTAVAAPTPEPAATPVESPAPADEGDVVNPVEFQGEIAYDALASAMDEALSS